MALIVLLLFQSNNIVASLFLDDETVIPQRVDAHVASLQSTAGVEFVVGQCKISNKMTELIIMSGWAVCDIDVPITGDRSIEIILAADDYYYRIPTIQNRSLAGIRAMRDRLDLQTALLGFAVQFSTLTIKNGNYRIMLYVQEGSGQCGLVQTGYNINKHGNASLVKT